MKSLQKLAGISAISEGLIYIGAFVYFGAFWAYPATDNSSQKISYLANNQLAISAIYFLMYVVFGVLLAVLVVGLHERLRQSNHPVLALGSLFGAVWVGLVIASGMLSNIGLAFVIELAADDPEKAYDIWLIISLIAESLGGGNELIGGLWVLLVSVVALQVNEFSKPLNYLGILVGMFGIATVYPEEIFTELFGVSQIVWFIWLGISLLTQENSNKSLQPTVNSLD